MPVVKTTNPWSLAASTAAFLMLTHPPPSGFREMQSRPEVLSTSMKSGTLPAVQAERGALLKLLPYFWAITKHYLVLLHATLPFPSALPPFSKLGNVALITGVGEILPKRVISLHFSFL